MYNHQVLINNTKKFTFFLLFCALLLLLFLFSETFLGVYIFAFFAFFFLIYKNYLDFSKIEDLRKIVFAWILFLASLLFSSFFTHSVPLTLNQLAFYFLSFNFFIFFVLFKSSKLITEVIIYALTYVVGALNIISLFLFFLPKYSDLIPGMNLVYSSYGHNHLGALLITVIPVFCFYCVKFWSENKKKLFYAMATLVVLSIVNLIISFGRVVIFIGFLEILVLGHFFYNNVIFKKIVFKVLYLVLVFSFLFLLLLSLIFSSFFSIGEESFCKSLVIGDLQNKVCKDLSEEARFSYWTTAWNGIADNFLFGYGLGTYNLINTKYVLNPTNNTSYAHNAYLQTFAEGGFFVFLSFLILMMLNLYQSAKTTFSERQLSLNHAILIGLAAIFFNVLFDFDWSFLGIFIATLLFFVIVFHSQRKKTDAQPFFSNILIKITKIVFYLSNVLLIMFALLVFCVEIFIFFGKTNQAFSIFPYYSYHILLFLGDKSLSASNIDKLGSIYKNHFSYYLFFNSEQKVFEYRYRLIDVDPWFFYTSKELSKLLDVDPEFVESEVLRLGEKITKYNQNGIFGIYADNTRFAILSSKIADNYVKKGEFVKAAQFYILGSNIDSWFWNEITPAFLYATMSEDQKMDFLSKLDGIKPVYFGKNRTAVAKLYYSLVDNALNEGRLEDFIKYFDKMSNIADWVSADYLNDGARLVNIQKRTDELIEQDKFELAEKLLKILSNAKFSYWGKMQLGNYFLLQNNEKKAIEAFKKCNEQWEQDLGIGIHYDCYHAENLFEEGGEQYDYYKVGGVIRGE